MRNRMLAGVMIATLAMAENGATAAAAAGSDPGARQGPFIRALMQRKYAANAPATPPTHTIAYGSDALQVLDFTLPQSEPQSAPESPHPPAPLVIFVHGGAWANGSKDNGTGAWMAPHFTGAGYGFATINYRLVPTARVEDEAADVAHALAKLIAEADHLGIDRHRIVLMGHSAGAHLVALVGTDESYLRAAGLSFADVAGIVAIDGAAYDVPRQMADAGSFMASRYDAAFGQDPARQRALSPALHAAAPNAPAFFLPHVQRPDGIAQAEELADSLRAAGTRVDTADFPGTGLQGHMEINRRLGDPDYAETPVVDAWLKGVFGK